MSYEKLFLRETGDKRKDSGDQFYARVPRERRSIARKDVAQDHLILANKNQILKAKDLSLKGIAVTTSGEAFNLFSPGVLYGVRFRYEGQSYETRLEAVRKTPPDTIGFTFCDLEKEKDLKQVLIKIIKNDKKRKKFETWEVLSFFSLEK
jgi:hypothetical protein